MVFAIVVAVVLGAAFYIYLRLRVRESGYNEWAQRWKTIDPQRRRRIARAIRRGEGVADPRDAALALELIDRQRELNARVFTGKKWRWFDRLDNAFLGVVILFLALLTHDLAIVGFACLPAAFFIAIQLYTRRIESRITVARQKNEQLTDRFS